MMVAMKSLSYVSIHEIAEYLSGLSESTVVSTVDMAGEALDGKVVYSMNCIGCHGADAHGQIGPAIRGISAGNIDEAIGRVPMMAGLKTLGSAEITAIGGYLVSLDSGEAVNAEDQRPQGDTIYASSCSACHGEDASGHIGPDIRGHTTDDVIAAIDRVPMMAGVKTISEQQLDAVGEYIRRLADPAEPEIAQTPVDGEVIFKTHCAACHGPDGRGLVGPDITLASIADITGAIEQVPMMVAMKVLGARDIEATADYLITIRLPESIDDK
jgi:mono/diheme cytochrome c family protein